MKPTDRSGTRKMGFIYNCLWNFLHPLSSFRFHVMDTSPTVEARGSDRDMVSGRYGKERRDWEGKEWPLSPLTVLTRTCPLASFFISPFSFYFFSFYIYCPSLTQDMTKKLRKERNDMVKPTERDLGNRRNDEDRKE